MHKPKHTLSKSKEQGSLTELPIISGNGAIEIFTHGACFVNPGPGGWGAIIRINGEDHELSGTDPATTNNKMELMAPIAALEHLESPCRVIATTDSQYVQGGITEWVARWKRNGWKNSKNKPVKNKALWERLDQLNQKHSIEWRWAQSDDSHPEMERYRQLARESMARAMLDVQQLRQKGSAVKNTRIIGSIH